MASILSTSSTLLTTLSCTSGFRTTTTRQINSLSTIGSSYVWWDKTGEQGPVEKGNKNNVFTIWWHSDYNFLFHCCTRNFANCAKQLSIDENSVTPQTKFADLGAESLDTEEIMTALEEKLGVSIGEGGAENIFPVQDAADLLEKVKAAST